MNFTISEGGDTPELLERFIKYYNDDSLRQSDICGLLDISQSKYRRIRDDLITAGRIDYDIRLPLARYVSYNKQKGSYIVFTPYNRHHQHNHILSYWDKREDAEAAVELYRKYGWDKKYNERIRQEVINHV